MAVLIDPPLWPAHGTLFSHLVSDTSLTELHAFAERLGVRRRAFDLDHYDVAAHLRGAALALGAEDVSAHELTRRLRASGLRIPAKERPARIRPRLEAQWRTLAPAREDLGEQLLRAWEEPSRHYHTTVHLAEVLQHLRALGDTGLSPEDRRILDLTAWFHDAVYRGSPGADEEASARWAERVLGEKEPVTASRVAALVRATADHTGSAAADPLWPVFRDADLGILAAEPSRYARYRHAVREEYAAVPEGVFRERRAALLRGFLEQDRLYLCETSRRLWETRARENLRREIALLEG